MDRCVSFAKRNYKISASVELDGAILIPPNTVFDTGAGPNLTQKREMDLTWHSYIRSVQNPNLLVGSKQLMSSCRPNYLTVSIGDFQGRVLFFMIQNLAVFCLLGTSFIDHHVKNILSGLWKVVFHHSPSLAITGQRSLPKPKTSLTFELEDRSEKIRTKRRVTTLPMSQAKVQAQCPTGGLRSVQKT